MRCQIENIEGKKFGRLTVFSISPHKPGTRVKWMCRCDCGRDVTVAAHSLKSGLTASCGCLQKDRTSAVNTTHGATGSMEYSVWCNMRQRCRNQNNPRFKDYGGRKLTVCKRWENFQLFLEDMGRCPSPNHTIERIKNSTGYSLKNCKWIPRANQADNRRNNINIVVKGVRHSLGYWCRHLGLNYWMVRSRIKNGWDGRVALFTPKLKVKFREL